MTIDLTLLPRVAFRDQEITAPRLRGLLALLAEDLKTGAGTGRLVDGLWPDEQPERPGKAIQVLVSRARGQLGAEVIESTPTGYRLALREEQVDSSALLLHGAAAAERARAGDHAASLAAAEAGLALWEGVGEDAGDDEFHDPVAALRAERAPVRRTLVRHRALALARLGRHSEAAEPLAEVFAEHSRDEEVLAEVLRGMAASAGPSAALARYEAYRRELRDDLGTDPGAALKSVQQELLSGDAPTVRHGVPHEPNPLLGRDADVAAVTGLLETARVVTVAGPGGLGKTRLAHAVSRTAQQRVVYFVPLAGVTDDTDVAAEVASALGAGEGPSLAGAASADATSAILGVLGTGPALLVLDNCEQVVSGVAALVQSLVSASKDLHVLTTSRAPLDLSSESVYGLPELGLETMIDLFGQRARSARPGVELPDEPVRALCRHLDGLPLAVELAAARVRVLSVPEIARRLGDRFALLRGGSRDAPERHRTLHAVVDWSWNLLEEDARAALRTLSAFPGGFTAEAAEHVLGDSDADALLLIEQLTDQSLLRAADTPAGGVRFQMLESVREFCAARRADAGEEDAVTERFLGWARDFCRAHHDTVFGADLKQAWEVLRAEQDNLVPAYRHALAHDDHPTLAATTAVLASLWSTDSSYERLLTLTAESGPPLSHYRPEPADEDVARTAAVMCTASIFIGKGPRAIRQLVTLRRLPEARSDTLVRALAAVLKAVPDMRPPDYEELQELCRSSEPLLAGVAESVASYLWEGAGDQDRALESARRMVTALRPLRSPILTIVGHGRLGELCLQQERGDEAYRHLKDGLEILLAQGNHREMLGMRHALALACLQRGEIEEAEEWVRQIQEAGATEGPEELSPELGARAEIALARGTTEVGLKLWRSAAEVGTSVAAQYAGDPLFVRWLVEVHSAAVTAHAYAGRSELVTGLRAQLAERLRDMLAAESGGPGELHVYGTMLHALAMAGIATGDPTAVRMLALAERLRALRQFQPTMSAARAREAAENADGAAYADAVSEYAALGREELREAARALIPVTSARR
ncbi:ATP-binding protein [Streptomyces boninensis]|uniref:ATP-binding protein n=1 Tax=Streptomyces boninensis TaxID=2039455 RepID=UPI003B20CDB3